MLQHADELSLLQAQIEYKKRLTSVMAELRLQEKELDHRVSRLKERMLQEQKDVARLEGPSLAAFFLNMTGQMDSVLTKERREAYAARVKYDAATRELQAIQEDILETEQDLQDLQDCEDLYRQKLEQLRLEMEQVSTEDGSALLEKEQRLQYLLQQEKELEEAIVAGTSALRTMADIQQDLHSAKDWTTHENRLPAFWADHARQEKLGEAQENVEQLQVQLQRFNKELSDVTIRPSLQVSIDRMLKFADSFFDNLTLDMSMLERIRESCTLADQTREHILGVLRQLQNALEEVRHSQIRIRQEMDTIVLHNISE